MDPARPARSRKPESGRPDNQAGERQAGDPNWWIKKLGAPDAIIGYAGQASVLPGEPVDLYVSTTAREFKVQAFRVGWYGGDLARKVWESAAVKVTGSGRPTLTTRQGRCTRAGASR